MKVYWHCKGCGKFGQQNIHINTLIKKHEELPKATLEVIMFLIDHECEDRDLGIKLSGDKDESERS